MANVIAIKTTRYSEFFRRILAEYSEGVTIEIDGKQHGPGDIAHLLKEWCTNSVICRTRDFTLRQKGVELFGFHDRPRELVAAISEQAFVERLEREKVLRFRVLKQGKATSWRILHFWPFTRFGVGLIILVPLLCVGCRRDPAEAAAQTRAATTPKLREQLKGITVQDGISQSEAEIIPKYYFELNVGCGGYNGVRDGGPFWIVEAQEGFAGTPVNGFHIDKKTGKISSPIGPSYSSPAELLR